jgi:hypothetical protein
VICTSMGSTPPLPKPRGPSSVVVCLSKITTRQLGTSWEQLRR